MAEGLAEGLMEVLMEGFVSPETASLALDPKFKMSRRHGADIR